MKTIKDILFEYKEIFLAILGLVIFFLVAPIADPWTAGASKDWLFRLPIASTLLFLVPTCTHLIYKFTFTSDEPSDYYYEKKRLHYAIIALGVLIFFSSLL